MSEGTFASGRVDPFSFAPSKETPYRAVVAEITPDEVERVRRKEIPLPSGWTLVKAEHKKRPSKVA